MKLTESQLRSIIREELSGMLTERNAITPEYLKEVANELRDIGPIKNVEVKYDRHKQKIKFHLDGVRESFRAMFKSKGEDEVRVKLRGPLWPNQNAYFGRELDVRKPPLKVAREIFRNVTDYLQA